MEEIVKQYLQEKENKITELTGKLEEVTRELESEKLSQCNIDNYLQLQNYVKKDLIKTHEYHFKNMEFKDGDLDQGCYHYNELRTYLISFGITDLNFIHTLINDVYNEMGK